MTVQNKAFLLKISIKRGFEEHKKDLLIIGLLILASTLSFAMGYITNRNTHRAPIIIQKCAQAGI